MVLSVLGLSRHMMNLAAAKYLWMSMTLHTVYVDYGVDKSNYGLKVTAKNTKLSRLKKHLLMKALLFLKMFVRLRVETR